MDNQFIEGGVISGDRISVTWKILYSNQAKQLGLACYDFESAREELPPWVVVNAREMVTGHFLILPYLEQDPVFREALGYSFAVRMRGIRVHACRMTPHSRPSLPVLHFPFRRGGLLSMTVGLVGRPAL